MAITLQRIEYINLDFSEKNKIWTMKNDCGFIYAYYTKNLEMYRLAIRIDKNFKTDGASVPSAFQWFLPKWDKKNMIYNCAAIIHDILYTNKGCNGKFTREEVDDFFRGGVRCAGYGRFKAGVADKCIEWFAGGKKHWGSDDLDNKKNNLFSISLKKI